MSNYSREWLPAHVHEEARRDAEHPSVVAREEELLAVERIRRQSVAESRRRRFLLAEIDDEMPVESWWDEQQETYGKRPT